MGNLKGTHRSYVASTGSFSLVRLGDSVVSGKHPLQLLLNLARDRDFPHDLDQNV